MGVENASSLAFYPALPRWANRISPFGLTLQLRNFFCRQMAKFSRLNVQLQRAVAHALDFFHVMPDLFEHAANLPIAALDQRHFVPRIGGLAQQFNLHRSGLHRGGTPPLRSSTHSARWNLQQ